ncbi:SGNH/GDSL hydrolase family protein [Sphingosinicella sp. BN140058]|uniref:SGNH/GDSL hydrolase family protein n=1 Tax=Sphingosinicella sp. BN140058 TaxID=1892855 RepID=UPI001013007D|nr:SGNH/GDSL hydrolase family protein [Sphingosinicella sp. BN140058]QAY75966.1 SGNH/GDSL hydrolase family protein [Sphingosinicella sp. BN140058]
MGHVILLGDSIFDNGVYVPGEPDVVQQLRAKLPFSWQASLLAVDGAVTGNILSQLTRLPADAGHLVVSAGGNDALGASHVLGQSVGSVAEAVSLLEVAQSRFAADYAAMADAVLARGLPTAFCTIYDTPPSAPDHRIVRTALAVFNDVITRTAFARGATLIDLRLICDRDEDYANPIEPSAAGGNKIASAIARFASGTFAADARCRVVASAA